MQKFEAVKDLMLSILDNFSTLQHYVFFKAFVGAGRYFDKKTLKALRKEDKLLGGLTYIFYKTVDITNHLLLEPLVSKSFAKLIEGFRSLKPVQQDNLVG